LVTGASKGIGFACAAALAEAGARVVGVSRQAANLADAAGQLAARGFDFDRYAVDLTDAEASRQIVDRIEQEVGPISVLINSAGAARRFAPAELDAAAFRQGMDAKYFTTVHVLEPVAKSMAKRGHGSIVNIVGQGGRQAGVMHIAGGAANAALMLATVGYARAYAASGVRVNAINPGLTRTGRVDEGLRALARSTGRALDELLRDEVAQIPAGRMAEPEEIASVAVFLASRRASYVSGAIVPMDGCKVSVI